MTTFQQHTTHFVIALIAASRLMAQIEPDAGTWKTWVLSSGTEVRLSPPPDNTQTAAEITWLKDFIRDSRASGEQARQIRYWTAGSPSYRWIEIALNQIQNKGLSNPRNARAMALMNIAVYDAMISAWATKYENNRLRPAQVDNSVPVAIRTPGSPSYPSELAVAAGAASEILAYIWPADAQNFRDLAMEAGRASLAAGINYPSDLDGGLQVRLHARTSFPVRTEEDAPAVWRPSGAPVVRRARCKSGRRSGSDIENP